jgi:hypothetical protein
VLVVPGIGLKLTWKPFIIRCAVSLVGWVVPEFDGRAGKWFFDDKFASLAGWAALAVLVEDVDVEA